MTPAATELLAQAEAAQAAVDLEGGLPASGSRLAAALVELLADSDLSHASPRAVWNLLWLAADLTVHVDVYRAMQLLSSVARLFERHFQRALTQPGELQQAAEMAFDFFFNRPAPPLVQLRFSDVLLLLERVLHLPNRYCRRAAVHGLGHLRQNAAPDDRARIDATLDAFADADATLADYARQARAGTLD
jgi:hypothetical protein